MEKIKETPVYKISEIKLGENTIKAYEITAESLLIRIPIVSENYGYSYSMVIEYHIPLEDLRKALLKED